MSDIKFDVQSLINEALRIAPTCGYFVYNIEGSKNWEAVSEDISEIILLAASNLGVMDTAEFREFMDKYDEEGDNPVTVSLCYKYEPFYTMKNVQEYDIAEEHMFLPMSIEMINEIDKVKLDNPGCSIVELVILKSDGTTVTIKKEK